MLPAAFAAAWLIAGREVVVRLALGSRWEAVPDMLKVAAFAIPAGALYSMGYRTAYALGRTSLMLRVGIIDLLVFAPTLAVLWRFGIMGVAGAWLVSRFVSATLINAGIWRQVAPPAGKLAWRLGVVWIAAALAGLALHVLDGWLASNVGWPLLVRFGVSSLAALAVYVGVIMLVLPDVPRTVWILSRDERAPGDSAAVAGAAPTVAPEPATGAAASEEFLGTGDPQALVTREQRT
jgi:hypothetical protein